MYSVAMVIDGYVYGVLLMEDGEVRRAWVDPEIEPGTICERMEFHSNNPSEVIEAVNKVLAVRYIPEVDPKVMVFNFYSKGIDWNPPNMN